jgi:hypothetical protein
MMRLFKKWEKEDQQEVTVEKIMRLREEKILEYMERGDLDGLQEYMKTLASQFSKLDVVMGGVDPIHDEEKNS